MAAGTGRLRPGCVFHSDRGAQYTSAEYAAALTANSMLGSMGRTGICWDNAAAESFFASLKKELVYRTAFPTPAHARSAVAEYIEVFYNRQRLHSSLGYRTPAQAEADHNTSQQASRKPQVSTAQTQVGLPGKAEPLHYARPYLSEKARRAALPRSLHTYDRHRHHTAISGPPASRVTNLCGQHA